MSGSMADDAKAEDGDKGRLRKTLQQLRKDRDEENEARALLKEMQQNFDEAHAGASENRAKNVLGGRGVHVFVGPRNWKAKQSQGQILANDEEQQKRSRRTLKKISQIF